MKCCCKISIMQFYKLFKKIIWRHIYISKDDFINKALPFAKISPLACWWIWIFLSFLRKSHVADFIPIGALCTPEKHNSMTTSFSMNIWQSQPTYLYTSCSTLFSIYYFIIFCDCFSPLKKTYIIYNLRVESHWAGEPILE